LETNFVALFSCYLSIQTICIVKSAVKTILIVVLNRFELNWRLSVFDPRWPVHILFQEWHEGHRDWYNRGCFITHNTHWSLCNSSSNEDTYFQINIPISGVLHLDHNQPAQIRRFRITNHNEHIYIEHPALANWNLIGKDHTGLGHLTMYW